MRNSPVAGRRAKPRTISIARLRTRYQRVAAHHTVKWVLVGGRDLGRPNKNDYANTAVAQVAQSQQMQCGFHGPRWDADREAHVIWCGSLDGDRAPPTTEAQLRIQELQDCSTGIVQQPAGAAADILRQDTPNTGIVQQPPGSLSNILTSPLGGNPTATVTQDVDVYDAPGGNGNVTGVLRANATVQLAGACQKPDWCHVLGPAVPNGNGWVWGALQF
jgi:hypothetical protein